VNKNDTQIAGQSLSEKKIHCEQAHSNLWSVLAAKNYGIANKATQIDGQPHNKNFRSANKATQIDCQQRSEKFWNRDKSHSN
jgi:hypothetical protein